MNVPRLLPLIGVSVAGVIAVNLLAGAHDLPSLLSAARAYAEGPASPEPKGAKPAKGETSPTPDPAKPALPPQGLTPAPAGVCAPNTAELARSAGLSEGEFNVLENLKARRGQIDAQAKDLDTQVQLLAAAELKLDEKLKAMQGLKDQIQALLGQADQKSQAEVDRLTVVYTKMPSKQAAPIMAQLDDKVRVPIAAQMKPAILAAILKEMAPADAKKLTELLAHRFAPVQQLADAAKAPPSPTPPAPEPKADAKTAKAQPAKPAPKVAEADPNDANVDDAPTKAKAKPVKLAKRAPPKKKPAYKAPAAKKPVEEAKAPTGPRPYSEVKDAAKPTDKPAKT